MVGERMPLSRCDICHKHVWFWQPRIYIEIGEVQHVGIRHRACNMMLEKLG